MRFILIALVSCLAVLAAPRPRSAAARPRTRLIAKRQTTRARIMGRESEKRIQAAAVRHNRTRALAPRASVAPYARYQGTETSPRTYAFFPGWDVAGNDMAFPDNDTVGRKMANLQECIDTCDNWKTNYPQLDECTAVVWQQADDYKLCFPKGERYDDYNIAKLPQGETSSTLVGSCEYWTGPNAPVEIPREMAELCSQLDGK